MENESFSALLFMKIDKLMKKKIAVLLFLFLSFFSRTIAFDIPEKDEAVTDVANILTQEEEQKLEKILANYEQKTTNAIVVLTIASTQGEDIAQLWTQIAEERW